MSEQSTVPHPAQDMREHRIETSNRLIAEYLGTAAAENVRLPTLAIVEEKPQHITMAYLIAAGRTRVEIAQVLGCTVAHISQVVRQPWFQKRLKEITDANGKDMVKSFLEGEVLPSLEVLRDIRNDTNQRGSTRIMACQSILDRFLGKPMVHVESNTKLNIHTAAATVEEIQRELVSINEQLVASGVKISTGAN